MSRILIFTGKGGVGKTSIAAAHAVCSAHEGARTLIVSTDMAHSLGDIFEMRLGKTICSISENLDALEIDPSYTMENDFKEMKRAVGNMLKSSGMPMEAFDSFSLFPGMDELFSLLKILEVYESGQYERIIVDCAPTGETLTLLKFPELLSWYMEKFFPIGKIAVRVLSPISKAVFQLELPDQDAMTDIEKLFVKLIRLQELLKDKAVTSIRLVAMAEKMVVEETKRNYMYMNLYNFQVDGLFINRILPKDMDNSFFNEWIGIQNQYVEELKHIFVNVPIHFVPWFDAEIKGLDGIEKMAQSTLKGWDVFETVEIEKGEVYEKTAEGYMLKLFLPTIQSGDLDLHESTNDIIIRIGNFKRNIPKPTALRNHLISGAKFVDQMLMISLTAQSREEK
jgi:arsenite/tail-anchored protein-transporting ATPase